MKATIVDLRYKMKEVLKALERNERVTVFYHGKAKGVLVPAQSQKTGNIQEHPFFGMFGESNESVAGELDDLRQPRYHDI